MNPKVLLRISALSIFLNAAFHVYVHLQWKSLTDIASAAVVYQLPLAKISMLGTSHSLADYFDGYGYIIAIFLVLVGALLWALSDISEKFPAPGLKLLIPLVLFLIVLFFYTLVLFIPIEAVFSVIASALCTRAIVILHGGHVDFHLGKAKE
jgi:hypothetical protein